MSTSIIEPPVPQNAAPAQVIGVRSKPEAAAVAPSPGWEERVRPSTAARMFGGLFTLCVAGSLAFGWSIRDQGYLTAEEGLGYWLGVAGASLMAGAILYPLRKRGGPIMRRLGAVRHWFRAHMLKGILGPLCILYHANFQIGSLNSTVALGIMGVVVASGLVGRYIYTKVHYGLYGSHMTLASLSNDRAAALAELTDVCALAPRVEDRVQRFETRMLNPGWGVIGKLFRFFTLEAAIRWNRFWIGRILSRALKSRKITLGWSRAEWKRQRSTAFADLDRYLNAVRRVVGFRFYERLFSLWHLLHMPLFLLLVGAVLVHVAAVHLY